MLMIHVNVPLQISRGIFVCGEIIKMHTIHRSNYIVMKLPRNGKSKLKKINKTKIQFVRSHQAQLMGWMHLMIITQIIHS